jgi:hypothetical protein
VCRIADGKRNRAQYQGRARKPIVVEEAAALRASGKTWTEIGAHFGVSDVAVRKAMQKAGKFEPTLSNFGKVRPEV